MNRATRRKLARNATCPLCGNHMTQQDRAMHQVPSLDGPKTVAAHPKCIAKDAQMRAARAEAALASLQRATTQVDTAPDDTAQRAAELGLWVPQ